jgi:hypothetical protein
MDFGIDPSRMQALEAGYQSFASRQPKQKKKGNIVTNLLPSAGGIGGGALGGAAAGSIFGPGGALLGALLGGAAGGSAGKLTENAIEGNQWNEGVGREAAMNGVFAAGPLRLLKAAGTAGKTAAQGGSLSQALTRGGEAAARPSALKTSAAAKLNDARENLGTKAFGLTQGDKTKIRQRTGETAGSIIKRYGLNTTDDIQNATSPLFKDFDDIVTRIPSSFSKQQVNDAFKSIYGPMLVKGVPTGQRAIGQQLKNEADNLVKGIKGNITPAQLNEKRQAFDQLAYKLRASEPGLADINKQSRDVIQKLIRDAADGAGIKSAGGQSLKEVGSEISKLKRIADAAGKRIESTGGRSIIPLNNVTGTVLGATGGLPGAVAGTAASMAINSPAGRRAAAKGVESLAGRATSSAASKAANRYGVKETAKRVLPTVGLYDVLSQSSPSMSENNANPMMDPMTANTNMLPPEYADQSANANMPSDNPFDPANAQSKIAEILANGGDMDDVKDYLAIVETLQSFSPQTNTKPLSAEASKTVNNAMTGLTSLDQLESIMASDPSARTKQAIPGRSALGGLGANVLGTSSYDAAQKNIIDVITRLRTGAAITESEERFYRSMMPQAFDPPEVAQQKLQVFRDLFTGVANQTGSAGSDLQAALQQ